MVTLRQEQLGNITILDKDETGTITANEAKITQVSSIVNTGLSSAPTTGNDLGSFWVGDGSPTVPKFTNSDGYSYNIGNASTIEYYQPIVGTAPVTFAKNINITPYINISNNVGAQAKVIVTWLLSRGYASGSSESLLSIEQEFLIASRPMSESDSSVHKRSTRDVWPNLGAGNPDHYGIDIVWQTLPNIITVQVKKLTDDSNPSYRFDKSIVKVEIFGGFFLNAAEF